MRFVVGLDLGQVSDFSALAVLERLDYEGIWAVRDLRRFPLGIPYPAVAERIGQLMSSIPLRGASLVVDRTGVGRAVVDLLRAPALGCRVVPVTITSGENVTREPGGSGFRVPKRDLVSVLQVLLQNRRLKVAAGLPEAKKFQGELAAFKVQISDDGHDGYGAGRASEHDDLVVAVALAAWFGQRHGPLPSRPLEVVPPAPRGRADEILESLRSETRTYNPDLIAAGDYLPSGFSRPPRTFETRGGAMGRLAHWLGGALAARLAARMEAERHSDQSILAAPPWPQEVGASPPQSAGQDHQSRGGSSHAQT